MLNPDYPAALKAEEEMLRAALGVLSAERGREDDPHYAASLEYNRECLALAARNLHEATEALPRDKRPVGWNTKPHQGRLPVSLTRDDLDRLIAIVDDYGAGHLTPEQTTKERALLERLRQERAAFDRHPEPAAP